MNKNPFVPQHSYTPHPPLPPGPPPPPQPDYNSLWALQTPQQPQPTVGAYQWQASGPPADLYANYGYGGQQTLHWPQQRSQVAQTAYPPPPPTVAPPPPPPPAQPGYNPYQPTAGYPSHYLLPTGPGQLQQQYQPPPQSQMQPPPPQQFFQQQQQHPHQQHQQRIIHNTHHTPPQHPAKRQRFEPPNQNQNQQHGRGPAPPPPASGMYGLGPGSSQNHNRGGAVGVNQMPLGGDRGGAGRGRGNQGARGTREPVGGNRGGVVNRGGRGGGMYSGGGGGGGRNGGQRGPLRGHGSRGGFGNNKDFHNRRSGGSFNNGGGAHHQQNSSSFRGRSQPYQNAGRPGRYDSSGGASSTFGARDGPANSSFTSGNGKKDENRRTLTDFKIIGLEIRELAWKWGVVPLPPSSVKTEAKEEASDSIMTSSQASVKEEAMETDGVSPQSQNGDEHRIDYNAENTATLDSKPTVSLETLDSGAVIVPPPPSRIRIYFHTPVSADDSHPIPHSSSFSLGTTPSDSRKGKRKKLEDDDGDLEEGRGRPPPPQMGGHDDRSSLAPSLVMDMDGLGRGSVAPSVAESASLSEGDWLMAAIVEDEGEGDDGDDDDDADGDTLHVSQIEDPADPSDHGGDHSVDMDVNGDTVDHSHPDASHPHVPIASNGSDGPHGGQNGPLLSSHSAVVELKNADASNIVATLPPSSAGKSDEPALFPTVIKAHEAQPSPKADSLSGLSGAAPASDSLSSLSEPATATAAASSASAPLPHSSPEIHSQDQSADHDHYNETQVPEAFTSPAPLHATDSIASTVPERDAEHVQEDIDMPATQPIDDEPSMSSTIIDDAADNPQQDNEIGTDSSEFVKGADYMHEQSQEHLPEPPASPTSNTFVSAAGSPGYDKGADRSQERLPEPPVSPTSNTLVSTSTTSVHGESSKGKSDGKFTGTRTPSANRLSISYAAGSRRLVVDAGVVAKLKVFRGEGRIEVILDLDNDRDGLKGIVIEGLSEATKSYLPLPHSSESEPDLTLPPFSKATMPLTTTMIVYLDTERPLSEPKWVKSGDVQEWLKSMFGRMFWVAGDATDGWEKKIEVIDPDPAPTIWTMLDSWAVNSPVGVQNERQRFLKTHMREIDNILEILLRLVRGERATPFSSQSTPAISAPSVSGPLLSALSQGSAHGAQQTHVSLAVLAMFQMAVDYAKKAVGEKEGKSEVEEKIGEIIRCLPSHLIYKSLDGIFKEWRVDKKGGRSG